jgi:hypothetical protein
VDGTLIIRSPESLKPFARCLGEHVERWAAEKPDEVFLANVPAMIGGRSHGRKRDRKFTRLRRHCYHWEYPSIIR